MMDPVVQNTQRLVQRVEELEDLAMELKSKQSADTIVELKQLISQLQLEATAQNEKLVILQHQRLNSRDLFQANDMHQSYLAIMKEREKVIEQLHMQIKRIGDNQVLRVGQNSFGGGTGRSFADVAQNSV